MDTDFFYEANSRHRDDLGLPKALEPFLVCAGCKVRRPCVAEALQPIRYCVRPDKDTRVAVRVEGIWGGTTPSDRRRVRHLPIEEAVDELEAGFPERLRVRVEAFERRHPDEPHRYCRQGRCAKARTLLAPLRARPTS